MPLGFIEVLISSLLVTTNLSVNYHQCGGNVEISPVYKWTEIEFLAKSPVELGKLTKLQVLTLDLNKLFEEIPTELGNIGMLYRLNFSKNQLTRLIPRSVGILSKLQHLDLLEKSLTGNMPIELCNCYSLLSLNLSHSKIFGEIPFKLGYLRSLQYMLDLSSNSLSGTIPQNLRKLMIVSISISPITTSLVESQKHCRAW